MTSTVILESQPPEIFTQAVVNVPIVAEADVDVPFIAEAVVDVPIIAEPVVATRSRHRSSVASKRRQAPC